MSSTIFKFKWPDQSPVSRGAFLIVRKLRRAGYETYLAGGAVRDALLGRPIREIDIATSAKPDEVKKMFRKTIATGEKHGTITVLQPLPASGHPPLVRRGQKGICYEVTTFRLEGAYEKNRRPKKVKFITSPEEDAKRRDFTVNALFYDIKDEKVIDYVNGLADLTHRRIRFVGKPEERVTEDALRMMRAVRFATTLHFDLGRDTRKVIQEQVKLITKISAERIKQELDRIMLSPRPAVGIGLLDIAGLLQYVLPEVRAMQKVAQPKNQHCEGDVYSHSLLALEQVDERYDLEMRYATLLHDAGKPPTKQIREGKITFYDHPVVGAKLMAQIGKRLKFSAAEIEKISWLIKCHMVPNDFRPMRLSTRRKWGLGPYFVELLLVYLADTKASLSPLGRGDNNPVGYREGLEIIREIENKPMLRKPLLSGRDVMKILKIGEGPRVGKVLKLVEEKKLANKLKTKSDAMKFLKSLARK